MKNSTLRASGKHVVIDGRYLSACTLVLGVLPAQCKSGLLATED
jgi:hypothetical protein